MIKVILFDCDGIIVKEREKYFSVKLAEEQGMDLKENLITDFFKKEFLLCETGKLDLKVELKNRILSWGYKRTVDDLMGYWFEGESELVPSVVSQIKEIRNRGVKCFVSTQNEKYRTDYLWNVVGLSDFMDGMFSTADLGYLKSEVNFWQEAYRKLGNYNKLEILVWDNKEGLCEKAKQLGFLAEYYTNFESFKKILEERYQIII